MTIISGTTVNWRLSPRVITIPASETSISVEDLQDTLLDLEDEETDGILWPHLRNTSGGESLGGGVSVGWTMELQNAQVAFAPRTISKSEGTITTANTAGTTLIDSAATFQTDGVTAGATIINFTDKSVSTVISVDSETQLTCYALGDGIDNQFDSADVYKVWNEIQCEIAGGNTVAVDAGEVTISAIRPTFGTQILKTSSSAATTANQSQLEHSTFNQGVSVNTVTGSSGTTFPLGTPGEPVDNIPDALSIAVTRGFGTIYIQGDIILDTGDNLDGYTIIGENPNKTTIEVLTGASTIGAEFRGCLLHGVLDGGAIIRSATIGPLQYVDGIIFNSMIKSETTIQLSGVGIAHFIECFSGTPGTGTPTIDFNGAGSSLAMRGYKGGIKLTNKTGTDPVSVDLDSGQIKLDPNPTTGYTNGTIVCRGDGKVINADTDVYVPNGTSTFNSATVLNETNSPLGIADAVWDEATTDHTTAGTFGKLLGKALTVAKFLGLK